MKKGIQLLVICSLLLSCKNNSDSFVIDGYIKGGENKYIKIEEITPTEILVIDSIQLDNKGEFKFKYKMPYKSFYNIVVSPHDFVMLLPDYGEKIKITGNYNNFSRTYQLVGSPESQLLWQLNDYTIMGADRLDSIKNVYDVLVQNTDTNFIKKEKQLLDSIYLNAYYEQQDYIISFIEEHNGSLSTLIALYKTFNTIPLIRPEQGFEYYEIVNNGLKNNMPENPHTLNFDNTIKKMRFKYGDMVGGGASITMGE
jgi:hypothetical protein